MKAARPPMAKLADGTFTDQSARLHDRRLVAQHEPGLAGQIDVERARGERQGLLARASDGFLEVERPVRIEHLARLGRMAVVSARDVHQSQLVVRERLLEGLDHVPYAQRFGFVAHRGRPFGDDRRDDRKHGSGPHDGKIAQGGEVAARDRTESDDRDVDARRRHRANRSPPLEAGAIITTAPRAGLTAVGPHRRSVTS